MNNTKYRGPMFVFIVGSLLPVLMLSCGILTPASVREAPEQPAEPAQPVDQIEPAPTVKVVIETPAAPPVVVSTSFEEDAVLVDLYSRINPAVVNITIFQTEGGAVVPIAQGSGFVYDNEGHVVTNAHVVHGSEQVEVTFADGSARAADVVGEDLNSDLAVVKMEDVPEDVNPIPLGNMESLFVGQSVVAIGNPFGLEGTLTRGIISALGRSIPALTPFSIPQAIQTDAAINPGNSGGPLLNLNGEVIGVNAQIETGGVSQSNLGIGFAIPVSIIRLVVPDLIQNGEHSWAWLGVRGGNLSSALVKAMNLPVDKGAYISQVINGGPSDKAGLRGSSQTETVEGREVEVGGDVVTAVDGQPVNSFDDLLIYIALNTQPGQEVKLTILRGGDTQEITVTLEKRPENLQEQP